MRLTARAFAEELERLQRLRRALDAEGLDGFLVSSASSVRYLSGYAGSNGLVLVAGRQVRFVTDFRYAQAVEPLRDALDVRILDQALLGAVADDFEGLFGRRVRVGFESANLAHASWARLDEAARAAGSTLVPTVGLVERLRAVKTPAARLGSVRSVVRPAQSLSRKMCAIRQTLPRRSDLRMS